MEATEALALLSTTLTQLESSIQPILSDAKNLISESTELNGLEEAKLNVTMAYLVHDLIWIYLKTVGIETSTHPVMQELARVKGYFDKLKIAENKDKPRTKLNVAVANRFITAAIASGKPASHKRFDEILDAPEEEEDSEMEIVEKIVEPSTSTAAVVGKTRPKMDPFSGYDVKANSKKTKRDESKKLNLKKSKSSKKL